MPQFLIEYYSVRKAFGIFFQVVINDELMTFPALEKARELLSLHVTRDPISHNLSLTLQRKKERKDSFALRFNQTLLNRFQLCRKLQGRLILLLTLLENKSLLCPK